MREKELQRKTKRELVEILLAAEADLVEYGLTVARLDRKRLLAEARVAELEAELARLSYRLVRLGEGL